MARFTTDSKTSFLCQSFHLKIYANLHLLFIYGKSFYYNFLPQSSCLLGCSIIILTVPQFVPPLWLVVRTYNEFTSKTHDQPHKLKFK